ncbi:MAG: hypothetical protein HY465_04355 [Deltaproteobacteria bacterium]|nr:hypothetical protein [Deltaproteobacteria bacterium]
MKKTKNTPQTTSMDRRFDTLEGKFDNLEGRFDTLDKKIDSTKSFLEAKIAFTRKDAAEQNASFQKGIVEVLSKKIETLGVKIEAVHKDVLFTQQVLRATKDETETKLDNHEKRISTLEQAGVPTA